MIANLFTRCSGRLPEPPAPKAEIHDTQIQEIWNGSKWVQYLCVWNGKQYEIAKELPRA